MTYVLVVDDSLVDRQLAGRLLGRQPRFHVEYASDGLEALELIEARLPLAVVTDLHMPGMDGLRLIEAMQRKYPSVPVIVMTAHGSEEVALQAMTLGAADYVPKSQLVSQLLPAVEGVLALATGEQSHRRLTPHLRYEELRYELQSDLLLIPAAVDELQRVATDLGLVEAGERLHLAKSLAEALRNAICHGSRETCAPGGGRVFLRASFTPDEARFTVRDEGPGFDFHRLPDAKADPARLSEGGGRGLVLIRMFMDEVAFNDAGNEITMIKRRAGAAPHTAT
jgi:CheY-like chemotaxis protein